MSKAFLKKKIQVLDNLKSSNYYYREGGRPVHVNEATFLAFLANSKQIFTHHFLLSAMQVGDCKFYNSSTDKRKYKIPY